MFGIASNATPAEEAYRHVAFSLVVRDNVACVVPATEGGRLRGLGQLVAGDTLGTAWSRRAPNEVELPVYFSWTFSTGPVGDVETLARRLRTPAQYGGDAELLAQLHHIGERPVYVDGDHLLFNGTTPGRTVFEGVLSIVSKPSGARVYVDGHPVGTTPMTLLNVPTSVSSLLMEKLSGCAGRSARILRISPIVSYSRSSIASCVGALTATFTSSPPWPPLNAFT